MKLDKEKRWQTMIDAVMDELNVGEVEANVILRERFSRWGRKGGKSVENRHKFTTETAREAHKKRKV